MSLELMIILIIIIGLISSTIASTIGLGGGLAAIPFIMLVIGNHITEAKIISYTSIAFLSLVGGIKYLRQKRKPNFKESFLIVLGVLPLTIICELYLGPLLDKGSMKNYFSFLYAGVIFFVTILILLKDKIILKKKINPFLLPFFGMFIGFMAGTFGLSGGVLFLPLLIIGLKLSIKEATVSALFLKLITASTNVIVAASSFQYNHFGEHGVFWALPLVILVGSLIGSNIGPILNKKMSDRSLKILFVLLMLSLFVWQIIKGALML